MRRALLTLLLVACGDEVGPGGDGPLAVDAAVDVAAPQDGLAGSVDRTAPADAGGARDLAVSDAPSTDLVRGDLGQEDAASLDLGGGCPPGMAAVGAVCMDVLEAPNRDGALPLVMYTFIEAEAWCQHRGKRLCFDDEWTEACQGPGKLKYPYGDTLKPGVCNDDKRWRAYDQTKLNGWPLTVSKPAVDSLEELLAAARAASKAGATAADHVWALYQGEPAGGHAGCFGAYGVADTEGSVEEWTRRRSGGAGQFHGNLKGRYWAEPRTCQSGVTTHGDAFRFYEIGFRCCRDR